MFLGVCFFLLVLTLVLGFPFWRNGRIRKDLVRILRNAGYEILDQEIVHPSHSVNPFDESKGLKYVVSFTNNRPDHGYQIRRLIVSRLNSEEELELWSRVYFGTTKVEDVEFFPELSGLDKWA